MWKEIGISHAVVQKSGSKRFLTQYPKESIESGNFLKIPVLTGVVRDEGSMCIEGTSTLLFRKNLYTYYIIGISSI